MAGGAGTDTIFLQDVGTISDDFLPTLRQLRILLEKR